MDITPASQLPGRLCSGASTECELCNRNGQCVLDSQEVSCNCNPWFAGKNCQINLKLLLIVGAVSVCLMMIIACGVSCFCCRDRRKKAIPSKANLLNIFNGNLISTGPYGCCTALLVILNILKVLDEFSLV